MNQQRTVSALALLVAFITGGMIFRAIAEERAKPVIGRAPIKNVFQLDMETTDRWIATLTPQEREEVARAVIEPVADTVFAGDATGSTG